MTKNCITSSLLYSADQWSCYIACACVLLMFILVFYSSLEKAVFNNPSPFLDTLLTDFTILRQGELNDEDNSHYQSAVIIISTAYFIVFYILDVGPSEQLHMKLHKEKPIAFCQSDGIFTNLETHACCWQMNGCKFSYS